MGKKRLFFLLLGMALLGLTSLALADSMSPTSFSGSGPTGSSFSESKSVTINKGTPTTSLVDVFFLSDTTGSMGASIANVQTSANSILTTASGLGDVAFGVAEYKDTIDGTAQFKIDQNITKTTSLLTTAINSWTASGGGDQPESALQALKNVATTGAWRAGSQRMIVWFGDNPSHDPAGSSGTTLAQAIAALTGPPNVKVEALSIVDGALRVGLDAAVPGFIPPDAAGGQATAITAATSGTLFNGLNDAGIVAAINNAITTSFQTYSNVSIDTSEVPAGVGVNVTPGSYTGSFDRSIDRTFGFEITFTDKEPGVHTFNIYGTADGGRIATEAVSITSTGAVPVPPTLLLLASGFIAFVGLRRKIRK